MNWSEQTNRDGLKKISGVGNKAWWERPQKTSFADGENDHQKLWLVRHFILALCVKNNL